MTGLSFRTETLFLCFCLVYVATSLPIPHAEVPLRWAELNLELVRTSGFSPPIVSRTLALIGTAMFDAITPYTQHLRGVYNRLARRPLSERTDENRAIAASYAAYRVTKHIHPNSTNLGFLDDLLVELGLEIHTNPDAFSPESIGLIAADNVILATENDGSNEKGTNPSSTIYGISYGDDTNYFPVNDPQPEIAKTDCSKLRSLAHWQPLRLPTGDGGNRTQNFLCAHCGKMKGFALKDIREILPPGPPLYGTASEGEFIEQMSELTNYNANLTDQEKIVASFWADEEPGFFSPPGRWTQFVATVSRERSLNIVSVIKLLFLQGNTVLDTGIAVWAIKRLYDTPRPISAIQCLFKGQTIEGWLGPYRGTGEIDGNDWKPYSRLEFLTPSFPEYISGHSTFSYASAEVMKRFFCSDLFGGSVTVAEGNSLFEPKILAGNPGYIAGLTDVPNQGPKTPGYVPATNITLNWPTFTSAAEESGISRLYTGFHIRASFRNGEAVGRKISSIVWDKYLTLTGCKHFKFCQS